VTRHTISGRWPLGLALTLVTALAWGTLPIALKLVLASLDAPTVTWYRFFVAAVFLGVWLALRRRLPRLAVLGTHGLLLLIIVVAGLCGNYILYLLGLDRVTPSAAQVVIQLAPLFLALGGLVLFGERFTARQWCGFVLVCAGLGLFFHRRLPRIFDLDHFGLGVLMVLGAALAWAAYALAQKQLLARWHSTAIMWSTYVAASVVFLPWADPAAAFNLSPAAALLLLYACLNTLVAYGCFAESLAHWEASRASAVLATTPLLTLGFARLLHAMAPGALAPDPLDALAGTGAAVLVTGSVLVALGGTRKRPRG
jgi:drug/metabolite transporter (DMT)-like permease